MEHPKPRQWDPLSWVAIIAGLYWLLAHDGGGWLLFAVLPGALLLAAGIGLLVTPGDPRTISLMAAAALLGMVLTLPAWLSAMVSPSAHNRARLCVPPMSMPSTMTMP